MTEASRQVSTWRPTFVTPRSAEYFNEGGLRALIGHDKPLWPLTLIKELLDNALDACEVTDDAARRSRRAALRAAGARDGGAHGDRLARCRALPFTNPSSVPSPWSSSPPPARSRLLFRPCRCRGGDIVWQRRHPQRRRRHRAARRSGHDRIRQDGTLTLKGLPFNAGELVEVTIRPKARATAPQGQLSLRGTPVSYVAPFEPVALDDWESAG